MNPTGNLRSRAVHPEVQEPRGGGGAGEQEQLRPGRRRLHQRHREGNVPITRSQGGHGVVSPCSIIIVIEPCDAEIPVRSQFQTMSPFLVVI